nr:hypothetical protein [Tanacetum cinerariifolium]
MTWEIFIKKLTDKYCLKGEIKKLEIELWNLKVKGNDVGGYTQRFQELALMCTKFLFLETEKVDKYISGLPDNIHGNVMSARTKTLDFAIELANDLMDQKLRTYAERQVENKRKLNNNNQYQQKLLNKQKVVQAYAVGSRGKKPYGGSKPLCPSATITMMESVHPSAPTARKNQGHYRSDCPVLKNQAHIRKIKTSIYTSSSTLFRKTTRIELRDAILLTREDCNNSHFRIMPPKKTTTPMTNASIKQLIAQGVADALAEYKETRNSGNRDDSHDSGSGRRTERATREYTYSDFLKCQPLNFKGSVMASKPKTMQDEIEFANDLMDHKIRTFAERNAKNKRKLNSNSSDNNTQQPPFKRQNMARAYSAGSSEQKEYAGTLSLCNKFKFHHNGSCTVKCVNCKRVGHLTRYCRSPIATNNQRTLTCYECGNQGHYISDCHELKNQNHKNQVGDTKARRMVYALGGGETNQDLNNMEDDINA